MIQQITNQLCFRPMTPADISQIMLIERRAYTAPWDEFLYLSELTGNPTAIYTVASLQNKIVGYAGMRLNQGKAHLTTMVVDPTCHGQGFGKAILNQKINMMRSKGAFMIFLEVRETNTKAQKLYTKYGFVQTGRRERFYPDNLEAALVMTLTL